MTAALKAKLKEARDNNLISVGEYLDELAALAPLAAAPSTEAATALAALAAAPSTAAATALAALAAAPSGKLNAAEDGTPGGNSEDEHGGAVLVAAPELLGAHAPSRSATCAAADTSRIVAGVDPMRSRKKRRVIWRKNAVESEVCQYCHDIDPLTNQYFPLNWRCAGMRACQASACKALHKKATEPVTQAAITHATVVLTGDSTPTPATDPWSFQRPLPSTSKVRTAIIGCTVSTGSPTIFRVTI